MYFNMPFFYKKLRGLSLRIFNNIENNMNSNFFTNGEKLFITNLFKKFQKYKNKIVIFDIGANVGNYSSILIEESKKIGLQIELHIFEPTKSCFKILESKFSHIENIFLNNFGLSEKEGKSLIYFDKETSGLASLYKRDLKDYNIEMTNSEEIILKRVDGYIKEKNITHINFIKIDVEGNELKVLNSIGEYLKSDFIDYIQFEYRGCNIDSRTFLKDFYILFSNKDFSIYKIMKKGLEKRNYNLFMENFNYSNYVAISNKII